MNYVISIIENLGGDMARQCYWDVGRWSDLWRVWRLAGDDRPIIEGIEFQVGINSSCVRMFLNCHFLFQLHLC